MKIIRRVVVVDAGDIEAESAFWSGVLGGTVYRDEHWHSIVVDGDWVMGVQHAPNHVPPTGRPARSSSSCTSTCTWTTSRRQAGWPSTSAREAQHE